MAECCLCNVELELTEPDDIEFVLTDENDECIDFELEQPVIYHEPPTYDGEYEVIPKINTDQTLATKGKLLVQNVHVQEITVSSVSNQYGGRTVTVGVV